MSALLALPSRSVVPYLRLMNHPVGIYIYLQLDLQLETNIQVLHTKLKLVAYLPRVGSLDDIPNRCGAERRKRCDGNVACNKLRATVTASASALPSTESAALLRTPIGGTDRVENDRECDRFHKRGSDLRCDAANERREINLRLAVHEEAAQHDAD